MGMFCLVNWRMFADNISIWGGEYIACHCWWSDWVDSVDDELALIFIDKQWVENRTIGRILISGAAETQIDRSERWPTSSLLEAFTTNLGAPDINLAAFSRSLIQHPSTADSIRLQRLTKVIFLRDDLSKRFSIHFKSVSLVEEREKRTRNYLYRWKQRSD